MRHKRSDELPRYVSGSKKPIFEWPRRSRLFAVLGVLFLYWIFHSTRKSALNKGDRNGGVNWSRYAYSLYATDSATLCHAVLIFDALAKFGSKADRVLFYPKYWDTVITNSRDRDSQLLVLARDTYNVKLQPVKLLTVEGRTTDAWTGTWDKSVTKFLAFTLAYYDRIIALDSDITLLQSLDELFHLPSTPMAMPRAYWYDTKPWPLTSLLMVLQPSLAEFAKFEAIISDGGAEDLVKANVFDMELVNDRFRDSALILPHRPYALLTGEFRRHNHSAYLGNLDEVWDAEKVLTEAKFVHFSDWPLPKPWIMWPHEGLSEMQPDCGGAREASCAERRIWKGLYEDFRQRRKDVCKLLSVPAPDWRRIKGGVHPMNATEGTHHEAPQVEGAKEEQRTPVAGHDM
ncbi:glucose N-acetyltransferase 1 [Lindgomyces ingoldianus]|uniref:Glucose N-acetyltransferase 1 n=1 Tax=Lindgomyces ingoldianus TaxID=673940 RepID=A0ACB6QHY5_9PLEO|nr:glucose N-acetyltransferase 1 [Lindgomyces ingoldianus]KAF2466634.1 glucose N-acetyltransferase 1 [Lindgomyces ingoldianus]